MSTEGVSIDVEVVKETEKAFLLRTDDEELWVPKSQILDGDGLGEGDTGTVVLSAWFAQEKGLA